MEILRHFEYSHLPAELAEVSKMFHDLAHEMVAKLENKANQSRPDSELKAGLRKLLEAKDCFVRAAR
jgi:hypothetical protein